MKTRKSGFTLVEILIVVIILGILAAIVIPQFTEASNDARVSSLVSNLQTLQSQCELYKVQHNDRYPWFDETGALDIAGTNARLEGETDVLGNIAADSEFGPYMPEVPLNPFSLHGGAVAVFGAALDAAGDTDWAILNEDTGDLEPGIEP